MSAYRLTEREQEVTRLVLQGSSTAEIAAELVLSRHTVQQHLQNIFDKTDVRSRRELVGRSSTPTTSRVSATTSAGWRTTSRCAAAPFQSRLGRTSDGYRSHIGGMGTGACAS